MLRRSGLRPKLEHEAGPSDWPEMIRLVPKLQHEHKTNPFILLKIWGPQAASQITSVAPENKTSLR